MTSSLSRFAVDRATRGYCRFDAVELKEAGIRKIMITPERARPVECSLEDLCNQESMLWLVSHEKIQVRCGSVFDE